MSSTSSSASSSPEAAPSQALIHIGIDVSKAKLDLCWLKANGKRIDKGFVNTAKGHQQLLAWLTEKTQAQFAAIHICLEATGPYSEALSCALADAGVVVSVVNPLRIKGFAQSQLVRNKNDQADAYLLAQFCATMKPEPWAAPTKSQRKLRALVERLRALQDKLQQENNRLEAHTNSEPDAASKTVGQSIARHIDYLEKAIAALKNEIDEHIDQDPDLKRESTLLESIDAIGQTTAAKVLAYAGNVLRFDSSKAFAAFIGVAPKHKQSGASAGRTTMGKGGSNALRHVLFMPAMVALKHNEHVKALGARLKAKGMAPMAVVGAAMHKLATLIYGVLKSGKPYDRAMHAPSSASGQELPGVPEQVTPALAAI
jgi:transposase